MLAIVKKIDKKQKIKYLIAIVIILLFIQSIFSSQDFLTIILSNIVILLSLTPWYIYFKEDAYHQLPIIQIHSLFYALTFGLIGFQEINRKQSLRPDEIQITLFYLIIGLIVLLISYYKIAPKFFKNKLKPISFNWFKVNIIELKSLALILWVFTLFYQKIFRIETTSIVFIFGILWMFSRTIIVYLLFKKHLNVFETTVVIGLLIYEMSSALISGVLAGTISVFVFIALIYLYTNKKLPIGLGITAVILFILFQQVKITYREAVWFGSASNYSFWDKASLLYDTAVNQYSSPSSDLKSAQQSAFSRLDHLGTTAIVISMSPETVPYSNGETYLPLFTKWIPRAIWKDKPIEYTPNEWAKRYGLVDPYNFTIAYNLPWFTEYYVNFGFIGIITGMFLLGILIRFLTIKFSNVSNPIIALIGIALTFNFYSPESNFSLMIGNLLLNFVVLTIFLFLVNGQKRRI